MGIVSPVFISWCPVTRVGKTVAPKHTSRRTPIHNLKPHQRLTLIILIRRRPRRLPPNNTQLHMLNLQPHQQKVNPPHNHILKMVLALTILELDMQAILNADIHLDAALRLRRHLVGVHPDVLFADDVGHAARDGDAHEVAELDVDPVVGLVLLLDVLEVEGEGLGVLQVAGGGELLAEGEEFVVVAAVEEHLCGGRSVMRSIHSSFLEHQRLFGAQMPRGPHIPAHLYPSN